MLIIRKKLLAIPVIILAIMLCACSSSSSSPEQEVSISELMSESGSVFSPLRENCPWVELHDLTGSGMDISGWSLRLNSGTEYIFAEGTVIPADGYCVFWLDDGAGFNLPASGTLSLLKSDGELADEVNLSGISGDFSLVRTDSGLTQSDAPSPGYENSPEGQKAYLDEVSRDADAVRISEVMTKNRSIFQAANGTFPDWIELENISDRDVDLSGWHLSDDGDSFGWEFPDVVLPAGQRLLIYATGGNGIEGALCADFSLSQGETLCLSNSRGYSVDKLTCTCNSADVSLALTADGTFSESLYPTPGYENSGAGYDAWQSSLVAAGPLVINEVMVANFLGTYSDTLADYDWVEIKNISAGDVLLSDYYLSDSNDDYLSWQLPADYLAPGACTVILCSKDGADIGSRFACADFSLDSASEHLFLSDSSRVVDAVSLRDIPYECSYGRMDGQNGFFFFANPSPNTDNFGGCRRVSAAPSALSPDGCYEGVSSVTVELSGNGSIYYTTDGSLPTVESTPYTGPISISSTSVIRAVSVEDGMLPSSALTLNYIINEGHELPVLCIAVDDLSEFDHVYRTGQKGIEMPGNISFYEEDGSFTINCGIKLAGRSSLGLPKKNLSFKFRGAYGSSSLNYDIFDGGISEFYNLTLRAGTDYDDAIIRNELCQELCLQTSDCLATQRSKYCVVYINAQYWGIYALKDKINESFCATRDNVSKDSVSIFVGPAAEFEDFYKEVYSFCLEKDMSIEENYEYICSVLDVPGYIDWAIMEGYTGNSDIKHGNYRFYRSPESGNIWKPIFFDLDASFGENYYNFRNLLDIDYEYNQNAKMLNALYKNEQFKDLYLRRLAAALNGPLSNENVVATIDRLYAQIESEIVRDSERWGTDLAHFYSCAEELRETITASDYRQHSIDTVSAALNLSDQQREEYFGQ